MHIPYFGLIMIFVIWLTYEIRKAKRSDAQRSKSFWDRELEASSVRRKSTDDIRFIKFDESILPVDRGGTDSDIYDLCSRISSLAQGKIANLAEYTNTDLKMKYGVANFTELSEADSRFTNLTPLLGRLCAVLYEEGRAGEAQRVGEYSVGIGIHTSVVLLTLAKIYQDTGATDKIQELSGIAAQDKTCPASLVEKLDGLL